MAVVPVVTEDEVAVAEEDKGLGDRLELLRKSSSHEPVSTSPAELGEMRLLMSRVVGMAKQ
jgi:hypothetical protein